MMMMMMRKLHKLAGQTYVSPGDSFELPSTTTSMIGAQGLSSTFHVRSGNESFVEYSRRTQSMERRERESINIFILLHECHYDAHGQGNQTGGHGEKVGYFLQKLFK